MKQQIKDSKIKFDSGHRRVKGCPRVLGELLQEIINHSNQPLATAYRTAVASQQQREKGVDYDRA